jgi:hypothetical protein
MVVVVPSGIWASVAGCGRHGLSLGSSHRLSGASGLRTRLTSDGGAQDVTASCFSLSHSSSRMVAVTALAAGYSVATAHPVNVLFG